MHREDPAPARRRWPRLELVEMVQATIDGTAEVVVVNVADGGLLAVCPRPFAVGEVHELRFRTSEPTPRALVFHGRVIHCSPSRDATGETHAVGLAFVPPRTEQQREAIERFLQLCQEHSAHSTRRATLIIRGTDIPSNSSTTGYS